MPISALHIGELEEEKLKNSLGDEEVYIADTELVEAYEEFSTLEELTLKRDWV